MTNPLGFKGLRDITQFVNASNTYLIMCKKPNNYSGIQHLKALEKLSSATDEFIKEEESPTLAENNLNYLKKVFAPESEIVKEANKGHKVAQKQIELLIKLRSYIAKGL